MQPDYVYKATVAKVIDGDTIDFVVDLGFNVKLAIRSRLYGIDTPEVRTQKGRDVRDMLRAMLPVGLQVVARTFKDPYDKYGRWLAIIEGPVTGTGEPVNLNQWLVDNDYAKAYDGGKR